jgi:hypothetical protein
LTTIVQGNNIFCDVIVPFLPEDAGKELGDYSAETGIRAT